MQLHLYEKDDPIHHKMIANDNNSRSSQRIHRSFVFQSVNKVTKKLKVESSKNYIDGYLSSSLQMLEKKRIVNLSITLAIPSCPTLQVKLNDIFGEEANQLRNSFDSGLECCVKHLINIGNDIPQEMRKKLKDNIDKSYYYTTFRISGKSYSFENSNMSKYFSHCARNDMSPHLFVHFLSNYVKVVKFNRAA